MADIIRTADLCDAFPDQVRILTPGFHSFGGREAFFGPASTVACLDDNSLVSEASQEAGGGRVLVVDGQGSLARALMGGDLAERAAGNGWAGALINGAVRDSHELDQADLGIFALAATPMKTLKRGAGERDVAVRFAGQTIVPGEWVYADRDGVILADRPLHRDE